MYDSGIKTQFGGNRGQGRMPVQKLDEVCPALVASIVLVEKEEHGDGLGRREMVFDSENRHTNPVPLVFAALSAEGGGQQLQVSVHVVPRQ